MKKRTMGAIVATVAAGLILSGQVKAHDGHTADPAKVKCTGINECKGKGACGAGENGCHGKNSCKGKGMIETTDADCKAKGGKVAK